MVVAILALILAASGTAVAARRLVSGDSLIRRDSLSGNRLRNATVTGRQIKLSSLGQVPSARTADNADALGGNKAGAFESASSFVRSGLVTAAGGQTAKLATFGPFTVSLTCNVDDPGTFDAEVDVTSTTSNSEVFGSQLTAGTAQEIADTAPDSQFSDASGGSIEDFVAPPNVYQVFLTDAIFLPGTTAPCAASLLAAKS
jgi:hypothetical protein